MDPIEGVILGLETVLTLENLLFVALGVLLGTTIGVLPGLGSVAGAALVLPVTFTLSPVTGLMMIAGVYYGAMYAGSTTSILMKVPGEAAAVVAVFDGYPLAQKGRAGPVLFITTIGSFIAGLLVAIIVVLFAPSLASFGLQFGPAEFFALILFSFVVLSTVSGGGVLANVLPLLLGLVIGTIGQEPVSAYSRFTFGSSELMQGVGIVPVAVGAFGLAELLKLAEKWTKRPMVPPVRLRELVPSREEVRRSVSPWLRGTGIGGFFGLLPGPSAMMSTFASYKVEKSVSKRPQEFGRGAVEGVSGPEAANSAAATSSVVPILCLGIPFSATLALMLSAMMVHGVQPGPMLIVENPDIFWGVIISLFIGNVFLVILNIPMIGVWVNLLRMPRFLLMGVIVLVSVVGSFSVNNSWLDVQLLLVFGVLGYILSKGGYQIAPIILGVVLGPYLERYLVQTLELGDSNVSYFLNASTTSTVIWIIGVVFVLLTIARPLMTAAKKRRTKSEPQKSQAK